MSKRESAASASNFELELNRSEERFRLLVESVKDYAIFMLDPTGHIVSWNAGAQRIKQYTADEIVGKHFSIFYTQPDIDRNHPAHELELAKKNGVYEEEGVRLRKDGSRFWADVVITAMYDSTGELRGFAKVTRDITERRKMQEHLQELNRELEAFAYSVSHDLRAPLRAVVTTSRILLDDLGDKLSEEGREMLSLQVENARKLATTIDELLNFTRLSRQELKLREVDVSKIAEEVTSDVLGRGWPHTPKVEITEGLVGFGDETLVRVILQNLIQNAVKFSPDGGVIRVGRTRRAGKPMFFVSDEGIGFEMAYAKKIFLPFERLVSDLEFSGTGIGLANVERAINRLGGKIEVESELGKGTTFYFTLAH